MKTILNWLIKTNNVKNIMVQKQVKKDRSYRYEYPSGNYKVTKHLRSLETGKRIEIIEDKKITMREMLATINQRQILPFEINFDIDVHAGGIDECKKKSKTIAKYIIKQLEKDGLKVVSYFTGSIGFHIEVFIKEMLDIDYDKRAEIRELFYEYYSGKYKKYIDFQKKSEEVTIQIEGTKHRNTRVEKSIEYSTIEKNDSEIIDIMELNYNAKIPTPIGAMLTIKNKLVKTIKHSSYNVPINADYEMKCISFFMNKRISQGNRDNVLFILLNSWCKRGYIFGIEYALSKENIFNLAKEFSKKNDSFIGDTDLLNKVSHSVRSKRTVSCRYRKTVLNSMCKKELCGDCVWNKI